MDNKSLAQKRREALERKDKEREREWLKNFIRFCERKGYDDTAERMRERLSGTN